MAKSQAAPRRGGAAAAVQHGILPVQAIRALIAEGAVVLAEPPVANQLQPASLDLRIGPRAWRIPLRTRRLRRKVENGLLIASHLRKAVGTTHCRHQEAI